MNAEKKTFSGNTKIIKSFIWSIITVDFYSHKKTESDIKERDGENFIA